MHLIFPLLLFVIFLFCLGFLYREGMWGNAITLINVTVAGLLAVNFWEPLARMLEGMLPSFTFFWDMVAIWGMFCFLFIIFGMSTKAVSRHRVRFKQVVDQIGSVVFAGLVGLVMVAFTTMSLHTAPLAKNFLFGGFQPEKRMFFGLAPDRQWLGLMKMTSKGAFKRWNTREFDPRNEFIDTYTVRREALEALAGERKSFRVQDSDFGSKIPKR